MMDTVTEVKRAGGVATIRLQSGDVIKAPSALYLERRLRVGQAVDAEMYRAFIRDKGYPHALKAAVDFLSLRERSEQEIVQRLRRVHFHEMTIARVMETLAGHHLYSDQRFAETWVSRRSRKYGRQRIAMELKMKGVSDDTARQALDGLDAEDELSSAIRQAQKAVHRVKGDEQKLIQALVRRGYGWQVARQAAKEALKHAEDEAE